MKLLYSARKRVAGTQPHCQRTVLGAGYKLYLTMPQLFTNIFEDEKHAILRGSKCIILAQKAQQSTSAPSSIM